MDHTRVSKPHLLIQLFRVVCKAILYTAVTKMPLMKFYLARFSTLLCVLSFAISTTGSAQDTGMQLRDVIGGVVVQHQPGGTIIVEGNGSQYKVVEGKRVRVLAPGEEQLRYECNPLNSQKIFTRVLSSRVDSSRLSPSERAQIEQNMDKVVSEIAEQAFFSPGALGFLGSIHMDGKGNLFRRQNDGAFKPTSKISDAQRAQLRREFKASNIPNNYLLFVTFDGESERKSETKNQAKVDLQLAGRAVYVNFDGQLEIAMELSFAVDHPDISLSSRSILRQAMHQCIAFS